MLSNYIQPNHIEKFNIYDIFYNDDDHLNIIIPREKSPPVIKYILSDNVTIPFNLIICPHGHVHIYTLNVEYNKIVKIMINNDILETHVSKYPSFRDEIIYSTIVKDEDNYIKQWIDYHLRIGISRFIIYDNSYAGTLSNTLNKYIKNGKVLLIKWTHPYHSGAAQQTQQNHSIYAFRNSKYIGLFDIDEYLNIQKKQTINNFLEELIINEKINTDKIGSFRLLCKFFYNPYNMATSGNNFLKIFNCDNINYGSYEKNFVLPKNVDTFSVHMITSGKPMYEVDPKYVFFNHYIFLNKVWRGRNFTNIMDNSILLHL